jgi:hypothetical protein
MANLKIVILVRPKMRSANADEIRPASIKVGIRLEPGQRFGFHNFRHSLATFLINKGKDVKTIQGLLRHAKASTALRPLFAIDGRVEVGSARRDRACDYGFSDVDEHYEEDCSFDHCHNARSRVLSVTLCSWAILRQLDRIHLTSPQ